MSSRFLPLLLTFLLLGTAPAREVTRLTLYETVEPHMGTLFKIKLYSTDKQSAMAASRAAFARITQLDDRLSDYKPDSELNLATRAATSHPVHISNDLMTVLKASQKLSGATDGAFDVTIGSLTKLWRNARTSGQLPGSAAINAARGRCGYRKMHLDESSGTLKLDMENMQLDLGAIAKGYAADQALAVISQMGIQSALVAASGDLAFSESPPDQPGWKIGIDSLDGADKPFTRVLFLSNAAVSTSGGTEQFLQAGGHRFSHIINPETGMGLESDIAVTTVSRYGITADAAATAVSVLGCDKGLAFVEGQPGLAAFILEQKDGHLEGRESARFKTLAQDYSAKIQHGNN